MGLHVEVLEFQLERAAMAGFQLPVALRAVVVGHWVVGRCEQPRGAGEIASTAYRGEAESETGLFFMQD